jgi:hypothetical protein
MGPFSSVIASISMGECPDAPIVTRNPEKWEGLLDLLEPAEVSSGEMEIDMPNPIPGMDPYLEDPEIWRGFHHHLAEEVMRQLNPLLAPRYYADVEVILAAEEVRISASGTSSPFVADAAVLERRCEARGPSTTALAIPAAPVRRPTPIGMGEKLRSVRIRDVGSDRLVASLEILSPWNKRPSGGLEIYRKKRDVLLLSAVHLVEIDLLRGGERPGPEVSDPPLEEEYVILLNRAGDPDGRASEIWPTAIGARLPIVPVPLVPPDPDIPLDLEKAIGTLYEAAGYSRRIDYRKPVPPPPLRAESARRLEDFLKEIRLRA